ncbi:hypothetical protein DAPPUDRAFT_46047, partial [Daphnia pulex]
VPNICFKLTAKQLAEAMDPTMDPCEDFFQYACGGWIKNNPIPASKSSWSQFDITNQQLMEVLEEILRETNMDTDPSPIRFSRDMFTDCMDTDAIEKTGLKPLTDYLSSFGGWPMTLNDWDESTFDWKKASASAFATYNLALLVDFFNDFDSKNTERTAIYVDQESLILPRSVLVDLEDNEDVAMAYLELIIESAKSVRDWLDSDASDDEIDTQANAVLIFESQLAKITVPEENRRNSTRMYNPMSVTELQDWTDSIDWMKYLNNIYSVADITIPETEQLVVVETDYLKELVQLLDETPPRVLANYIHWRIVHNLAPYTNERMTDLQIEFAKENEGILKETPRPEKCVEIINKLMGYAMGSVYVERVFDDESIEEIKTMIANLKMAFKSLVNETTWMDPDTKSIAKDKVDAMIEFVGYPPWIKNKQEVEDYYNGIPTTSTGCHFCNVQQASALVNKIELSFLRNKPDRNRWIEKPTIVNAFYSLSTNSITFPAGILQAPYFVKGRSPAINYGAMGTTIGHEMTHGFDDQGRQSDKNGNTVQWWTEKTLENYEERAQCFIDQYSNYTVLNGIKLNGINTQGENIADNGGVREAFRAYRYYVEAHGGADFNKFENLTDEQLFFLAYANSFCGVATPEELSNLVETDPHSPNRFRIIGTLSNNEDFVREFHCGAGTPMNRLNKCTLW